MTQDEPAFNRLRISSPPQNASTSLRLTDPTTPTSSLGFLKRSMENSKSKAYTNLSHTADPLPSDTTTASFAQPRRARAGTMPSQSSISPYAPIGTTSSTTLSSFPSTSLLSTSHHTSSSRHRSGSLTLPKPSLLSSSAFGHPIFSTSWSDHNRSYGNPPLTPTTDQMLREDNSDSIVRTLMSLGLDDDDRKNIPSHLELSSQSNNNSTSEAPELRLPVDLPPKPLMNSNRYRSYSVNATDKYMDDPPTHLMSEPSIPYYPTSQSRARAVSLGMADFAANDSYLSRQLNASALRRDPMALAEEDAEDYEDSKNLHISLGDADLLNRMMNNGQDAPSMSETEEVSKQIGYGIVCERMCDADSGGYIYLYI